MLRTPRWPFVLAVLGLALLVVGGLVLRSPGARDVGVGWVGYGPPSPALLDSLTAWNLSRGVGAVLVVGGLASLVLAAAVGLARRRRVRRGLERGVVGVAVLLVVGGVVAFPAVRGHDLESATVGISKVGPGPAVNIASSVWTRDQAVAAVVVAAGVLLGSAGVGLRSGGRLRARAEEPRSGS